MSKLNRQRQRNRAHHQSLGLPFMAALALLVGNTPYSQAFDKEPLPQPNGSTANARNLIAQVPSPMPVAMATPNVIPKIGQTPISTLRQAVKSGKVTMQVQGDGVTTSSVRLLLTNTTGNEIKLVIPANEVLHPNMPGVQKMMVTKDTIITVPVGQVAIAKVETICASVKTIAPPPKGGVAFDVGSYPDAKVWKQLSAIIAASNDLERNGGYSGVPIKKEQNRKEQIAQLAVWRLLGLISGRPEHAVTPETIEDDMLKELKQQARKNPKILDQFNGAYQLDGKGELVVEKKQRKQLDETVASIFNAIDLTIRRSEDPNLKKVASLPQDSTWDTFTNVGERAFADGDFIESAELLEQAVQEAEAFGEADARLSRSLTSFGRTQLESGVFDRAETAFTRALSLREKVSGKDSPDVAEVDVFLGVLKQQQQNYAAAQIFFQNALSIFEKAAGATSKAVAEVLNNLGKNFELQGNGPSAEPLLKRALAIMMLDQQSAQIKGLAVVGSPDVAEVETNLATSYLASGKYAEANTLFQKALAIDTKALGDDHPYLAKILDGLASTSIKLDQNEQAELYRKQAQAIRDKRLGKAHEIIASLPLGYEALTRISAYAEGAKNITRNLETVKATARTISGASIDKTVINRPVKDKWALVIGVSKFQDASINLRYAAKDAKDFASYLVTDGKFAKDHVRVLVNEKATRENIMDQIGGSWLPHVVNPDDLVLIYISSHGSPSKADVNGMNYLVAHNTDKNKLYATGVAMQELVKQVKDRVHSDRVVLMMDACHSGAAETAGAKGLFRIKGYNAEELAQGSGQLVICSSDPTQVSWESNRYENGVFTHYLLEGLKKNGGSTKLGDAFQHMHDKVQEEVLRDRGELQTPLLKSKWVGDDLVLGAAPTQARQGMPEDPALSPTVETSGAQKSATKSITPGTTGMKPVVKPGPAKATVVVKSATGVKHK